LWLVESCTQLKVVTPLLLDVASWFFLCWVSTVLDMRWYVY